MARTLVKIYATFSPADDSVLSTVEQAGQTAAGQDDPWLSLEDATLRLAWEGVYFPLEEVLQALEGALGKDAQGRLDYLDLENWTITRYILRENAFSAPARRGLNQVLEYSGH
jgi:hypothetical protein